MGVTFLDANGLDSYNKKFKKSISLNSTKTNSLEQVDNEALGEHNIALGMHNKTLSNYAYAEGFMNLSGFKPNDNSKINVSGIVDCFTDVITIDGIDLRTSVIRMTSSPNFTTDPQDTTGKLLLQPGDMLVAELDTYYVAKFIALSENEGNWYQLTLLNHNIASSLLKSGQIVFDFYRIDADTTSENCHTEHIEGRYNLSAENGPEALCGRLNHIEGTTNVSFGQYNHLEGVNNQALNKSEMMHIEGRSNVADTEDDGSNLTAHLGGDANKIINSPYGYTTGNKNIVKSSSRSIVSGEENNITGAHHSIINGRSVTAENIKGSIVVGNYLEASGDNKLVIGKNNIPNSDAVIIVGNGESNKKNILELDNKGDLKILDSTGSLKSINSELESINSEISLINKKKVSETVEDSLTYHIPEGDLTIISNLEDVQEITSYSKNLISINYTSGEHYTKGDAHVDRQDNGMLGVTGTTLADKWTQYSLYGSGSFNAVDLDYLKPGYSYIFGIEVDSQQLTDSKGNPLVPQLKVYYVNADGDQYTDSGTTKAEDKYLVTTEIPWRVGYKLKQIFVQLSQNINYGSDEDFNNQYKIKPFIYCVGKVYSNDAHPTAAFSTPVKNIFNINESLKSISIDTQNNQDGLIQISKYTAGENFGPKFKDYISVEYVEKKDLDSKISDGNNSYNILIVDELPETQDPRTIYLVKE